MTFPAGRIDAHQHFWRLDRGDYDWMTDEVAVLRQDLLPADLTPHLAAHKITGTIVVQAAATVAETRFLLDLAEHTPFIKGVVGWIDLTAENACETLDELAQNKKFKGIRPMLQDIKDTNWILQPKVISTLSYLAQKGLRFDALIMPRHLEVIATLAETLPELPIVIDHCAKPAIAQGADAGESWRAGMRRLAGQPQIFCKLSGLATEVGPDWTQAHLAPVADTVLNAFSASRLMWGSDWPVLELAGTYDRWVATTENLLSTLSEPQKADIWGGSAACFYGLEPSL